MMAMRLDTRKGIKKAMMKVMESLKKFVKEMLLATTIIDHYSERFLNLSFEIVINCTSPLALPARMKP